MKLFFRSALPLAVASIFLVNLPNARASQYARPLAEREAIQKGVDFLTHGSMDWIRKRGCYACHANGLGTFVTGLSARNGYFVNQYEYDANARFVLSHEKPESQLEEPDGHQPIGLLKCNKCHFIPSGGRRVSLRGLMGAGFALGSQSVAKDYTGQTGRIAQALIKMQTEKGSWKPDYNNEKIVTGSAMVSALCGVVLTQTPSPATKAAKLPQALESWRRSSGTSSPVNTADIAFTLMAKAPLFKFKGTDEKEVATLKDRLFALQQADGSWPEKKDGTASIISTGRALYALSMIGVPREELHVDRAVAYLFEHQRTDGTWVPVGESKNYGNFPKTYTRTAWAIAGLSTLLDLNDLVTKRVEVLKELQESVGDAPEEEKLQRLARIQLMLRDPAGAIKSCQQLIAKSPKEPAHHLALARIYLSTGSWKQAAATYQEALKMDLPSAQRTPAQLTMAECLEKIDRKEEAASVYLQLGKPQGPLPFVRARRVLARVPMLGTKLELWKRHGLVTQWEVSEPFPAYYLRRPILPEAGGETSCRPTGNKIGFAAHAPEKGGESSWGKFNSDDPAGVLDFYEATGKSSDSCAYARLHLSSPVEQPAQIRLGSDGPTAVWLNGEEVHRRESPRSVSYDQDRIEITLPKGNSTLLIKVGQNKERWGLVLRLTNKAGQPLNNVTIGQPKPAAGK